MKIFIIQNKKYIRQTAILLVWLLFWQILYFLVKKDVLIASPVSVAKAFLSLCKEYDFWLTILASLCRILAGYLFSVFFGILFAVFCYNNAFVHALLQPAIQTIKATPVVSFSILVLLWVKTDFVPIIISFLMVFPLIWTNTTIGIRQTQKQYLTNAYGSICPDERKYHRHSSNTKTVLKNGKSIWFFFFQNTSLYLCAFCISLFSFRLPCRYWYGLESRHCCRSHMYSFCFYGKKNI